MPMPQSRREVPASQARDSTNMRLRRHAPIYADLLRVFMRICEPVAFAHAHDAVSRDLKPENIMVDPFGEVLVLDWGIAKRQAEPTSTGAMPC